MSSGSHPSPQRPIGGRRRFRYSGFVPLFAVLLAYAMAPLLLSISRPPISRYWSLVLMDSSPWFYSRRMWTTGSQEPLFAFAVLDLTVWGSLAWRSLWHTVLPGPAMRGGLPAFEQLWVRGTLVCGGALCGAIVTWLTLTPLLSVILRAPNASTAITDPIWEIGRSLVSVIVVIAVGFLWLSLFAITSGVAAAGLVAWLWRYYPWEPAEAEANG